MLTIDTQAPNFTANAAHHDVIDQIRLSDFRGRKYVVLLFYGLNFTPIASEQLSAFNDLYDDFKKANTEILAVSVDSLPSHFEFLKSLRTLRAFFKFKNTEPMILRSDPGFELNGYNDPEKEILDYKNRVEKDKSYIKIPLISDLNKEISLLYNVLTDKGCSQLSAFIIDLEGVIKYTVSSSDTCGLSVTDLLRVLKANKCIAESKVAEKGNNYLCPPDWIDGDELYDSLSNRSPFS